MTTDREKLEDLDGWNLVCAGPSMVHLRPEHLIPNCPVVTVNRAIQIMDQGIKVHFAAFADGPGGCWQTCDLERYIYRDPTVQLWVTLRTVSQSVEVRRKARWKKGGFGPNVKHLLDSVMKVIPDFAHKSVTKVVEKFFMHPEDRFFVDAPGPTLAFLWDRELPACIGIRVLPHGDLLDVHDRRVGRQAFTSYCALDRIWMFKPKKIRILCADMMGTWIEGKTEEECADLEALKVTDGKSLCKLDRWAHERYHMQECVKLGQEKFGAEVEWITPQPEEVPA